MNTKPSDSPSLGARVVNRRGGNLPGLAATLKVAELPNQRNGQLVLVYDSEGSGSYLHPSLTHEGRWCLGSRTVSFAADPAGQAAPTTGAAASDEATGSSPVPPALPREPELWVRPDATGSSRWHRVEAVPGDDPDQTTACGLLVAQEDTGVYELESSAHLPVCVGCSEATRCARCQRLCVPEGDGLCPSCYAADRVLPGAVGSADTPELHVGTEHSGLSGVWVLCSCGLSTNRQPAKLARLAWNVHTEHALAALREAVSVAYATRQVAAPRPASVTDLCDALADEFGCSPTEADRLAAGLAREADNAARVLLEPGTPCPPARLRDRVAAVLLTAAAKRKA